MNLSSRPSAPRLTGLKSKSLILGLRRRRILPLKALLLAASLFPLLGGEAATIMPVGPITFGTNASYDTNFKEAAINTGNTRNAGGFVQLQGFQFGPAVFDTSATGGTNGSGGTGGSDTNNDLSNFTISASFATSEVGQFGSGFLLRLDNAEANGYFASFLPASATSVIFELFEGAGLNEGSGSNIFSTTVQMTGVSFNINTFYPFKVTATNGTFAFDFASGAANTSFTDTTLSATTGQVGFSLTTASPSAATRMDNFAIVPEPGAATLLLTCALRHRPTPTPRFFSQWRQLKASPRRSGVATTLLAARNRVASECCGRSASDPHQQRRVRGNPGDDTGRLKGTPIRKLKLGPP